VTAFKKKRRRRNDWTNIISII